ncbi:MAG TPA: hypothetical protein VM686_17035 [Polyangiaceae bacterium]|jgi:hypothetical protein|nr:hypothetical protein [Polyangiaceae bacterium]
MKRTLSWVALTGLCLAACGGTSHESDPDPSSSAGDGGMPASAGTAGTLAHAGDTGSDDGGAPSAGVGGQGGASDAGAGAGGASEGGGGGNGEAGAGGSEDGGAAGAGGEAPCNDLELIDHVAPCTPFTAAPAETGGDIVDGVYELLSWEAMFCLAGLAQTVRVTQTAANTYELETVATLGGGIRANADFVTDGTTLIDTSTCGTEDDLVQEWTYSAYQAESSDYLRLSSPASVFVFQRVAD